MEFKIKNNNNKPKKVNFPFRGDRIYVIYYDPPFAYIREAERLLITVFSSFVDEWTIEYTGIEGKVRAILLYYGLPLMKKRTPRSLNPNLEDLENASSIEAYYYVAIQWILRKLENTQANQLMKLADIMRNARGIPIKVKDLEGKRMNEYTGNIKGILYDLIDIIRESKEIGLEEYIPYTTGKPSALKILGFFVPRSMDHVRTALYIILIGVIFVVAILLMTHFAKILGESQYLAILNQQNFTNSIVTLPIGNEGMQNETYHVISPLE
ncbi:MAG: hypothetical protein ACO2ON_01565 [Candidatus Nanopusillus sp.]